MLNSTKLKIIFGLTFINVVYIALIIFGINSTNINLNETPHISGVIEQIGVTNKKSGNPFPLYAKVYFVKLNDSEELFSFPYKDKFKPYYSKLEKNQSIKIYFEKNNGKDSTNDIIQIESGKDVILSKSYFESTYYLVIIFSLALIMTNYFSLRKLKKAKVFEQF